MDAAYRLVREHLRTAAERQKNTYDLRVRPAQFAPGDRVYYYIHAVIKVARRNGRNFIQDLL